MMTDKQQDHIRRLELAWRQLEDKFAELESMHRSIETRTNLEIEACAKLEGRARAELAETLRVIEGLYLDQPKKGDA